MTRLAGRHGVRCVSLDAPHRRVLFFIAGALLFIPDVMSDLAGLVLGALIVVSQIVFQRPMPVADWAEMATSGRIEDD